MSDSDEKEALNAGAAEASAVNVSAGVSGDSTIIGDEQSRADSAGSRNGSAEEGAETGSTAAGTTDHTVVERPGYRAMVQEAVPIVYKELERQLVNIIGEDTHERAKNIFSELTEMGKFTYQFAVDLISELASELTGVKALKIVPKGPLECDVEMKRKSPLVLKLKHPVAPFVELNAVTFGKELQFGALVDKSKKGLRMNITRGLALTFVIPILGEYVVDVKGSGLLKRTERNQLVLTTTVVLPGIDHPITIDIPLTILFAQNKKR